MNFSKLPRSIFLVVALAEIVGCAQQISYGSNIDNANPKPEAHFSILQVNDTYKIEGLENGSIGGFARLRTVRKQLEESGQKFLMLHAGDFLFPSVMSKY